MAQKLRLRNLSSINVFLDADFWASKLHNLIERQRGRFDDFKTVIRQFLEKYDRAEGLDEKHFDRYFPEGVGRADFLLFRRRVICEVKDFDEINIPTAVERVWKRGETDPARLAHNVSSNIRDEVRSKGKQVTATKKALGLTKALGLLILENNRPNDLSALALIQAADVEAQRSAEEIDGVLCVDFKNQFTSVEGSIRLAQIIIRPTEKGRRLTKFVRRLMSDFSSTTGIPVKHNHNIAGAKHHWEVDAQGKFSKYHARVDFEATGGDWRQSLRPLLHFLANWAWVIGLGIVLLQIVLRWAHVINHR